ncbi:site-specific DNA-methyltransferase [Fusobacterium watanabei]|uniref:site-specific DNA-methyltransferase n=1 Tax=Fusobacterium watanabei TaxID=2686067 RepID=UPI003B58679C
MEKLGMKTKDISKEKFEILKELFPNAVTETTSENKMGGGAKNRVFRTINLDVIRQEINENVIEGKEERYEFTWPEKRKAIVEANIPINKTLRPIREDSQNFDTTENLYIEGDNLEVLKLLRETYLGKIKMIYIDPPYNTGNDFIYNDDFTENEEEYKEKSGNYDEDGNRLFENTKSNGRFHTDWLNMIYPRLKLARDLLTDDGVIFISIDEKEQANLKKVCDEIFGMDNYLETFHLQVRYTNKSLNEKDNFQPVMEYIFIYTKNKYNFVPNKPFKEYELDKFKWEIKELSEGQEIILGNKKVKIFKQTEYEIIEKKEDFINGLKDTWASGSILKGNTSGKFFDTYLSKRKEIDGLNVLYKVENIGDDGLGYRYFTGPKKETSIRGQFFSGVPIEKKQELINGISRKYSPIINYYDYSPDFGNIRGEGGVAFNAGKKPVKMLKELLKIINSKEFICIDFFSGSSSTAHAVMQLNTEDGGNRKYIMVQLPEKTNKDSDAYKAGYKNICEIGKERIRRAAKKLKEENPNSNFDDGFRVLRVDSSNMKDVYYKPEEFTQENLKMFESNIKEDRTGEDLLFQVMLDLGIELSSKIEEKYIQDNKIYDVGENFLLACFDENITEEVVTEIAKLKPIFAIFKEGNKLTDNILINFEEIFKTYSPDTKRRVL